MSELVHELAEPGSEKTKAVGIKDRRWGRGLGRGRTLQAAQLPHAGCCARSMQVQGLRRWAIVEKHARRHEMQGQCGWLDRSRGESCGVRERHNWHARQEQQSGMCTLPCSKAQLGRFVELGFGG